ncbi:MAG: CehA/McbA family metallohydrolase [Candidatus Bathyarchaeota archaeon]|nr:CehA/McbA family metallohydrolase [Candidatus Bathyarchaeota archaeon]
MKKQVKVDFHVHSHHSSDSTITPKDLVKYAKKRSLDAIAIADHNQIEGALDIAKKIDLLIIPSTEISTKSGHIVGLNVRKIIPRGLRVEDTVDCIHDAGGLAVACHPFAWFKGSLGNNITENFDAIETINSSSFPFNRCKGKATKIAEKLNLAQIAGTDAHNPQSIGLAYSVLEAKPNIEDITKAILEKRSQSFGNPLPISVRIKQQFLLLNKYLRFRK